MALKKQDAGALALVAAVVGGLGGLAYYLLKKKPPPPPTGKCTPLDRKCSGNDLYECGVDEQWHLFEKNAVVCIPAAYICQYCNKQFSSQAELEAHIKSVHQQPHPYVCPYCSERFDYAVDLANHIALAHPYEPAEPSFWPVEYICPYCNTAFKTMTELFAHIEELHDSLIPSGDGILLIDTKPVKAEISISDTYLGITPLEWRVGGLSYPLPFRIGWHRVVGYNEPRNLVVFVIPGVTTKIMATYTSWGEPVPQLKPDSFVVVKTEPVRAEFNIEGVWQGLTPQTIAISSQWVWNIGFGRVTGYLIPRNREVITKPGETIEVIGTYVQG